MTIATDIKAARKKAKKPVALLRSPLNPEINKLIAEFNAQAGKFNVVELMTPTNAIEEKTKFLARDIADAKDPQFVYDQSKLQATQSVAKEMESLYLRLIKLSPRTDEEKFHLELLTARLDEALLTGHIAENISSQNDAATSQFLSVKFGRPDNAWAQKAWSELQHPTKNPFPPRSGLSFLTDDEIDYLTHATYDASEIAHAFKLCSRYHRFRMGWRFPVSPVATACDVRSSSIDYDYPALVVPSARRCSGIKLLELIGHEVGEHMRQEENGNYLFAGQGHAMMKGDEANLEGIAKISDLTFNSVWEGDSVCSSIPWYIIAIEYAAAGHGFADTAKYVYQLLLDSGKSPKNAKKSAWNYAFRVKRGNTQNMPDFVQPKDAGYFVGYFTALDLEKSGLGQYLDMGCFSTDWILRIAREYLVEPQDIPFPRRDVVRRFYEHEIKPHMW